MVRSKTNQYIGTQPSMVSSFKSVQYPMPTSEYDRDLAVVVAHLGEKPTSQSFSHHLIKTLGRQVELPNREEGLERAGPQKLGLSG